MRALAKHSKIDEGLGLQDFDSESVLGAKPDSARTLSAPSALSTFLSKHPDACVLFALFMVQVACFLPICFQIGFYLDDWLTFWNLHFAPHNPIDLIKASFNDPRMVTRPIQCLYYGLTSFFFGDRPLPYHLLRWALEFAGAACLYFGLFRLSGQRVFAALAAMFFIVYPNHDATHYWIGAGLGPGFGLTLYLASFYLLVEWTKSNSLKQRVSLYLASTAFFVTSAFCYESFLPMLSMSFCALMIAGANTPNSKNRSLAKTAFSSLLFMLPFVIAALAEPLYQRVLLPRISKVFLSPSTFDLNYFLSVFPAAVNVSIGPSFFNFCFERARDAIISMSPLSALQSVATVIAGAFSIGLATQRLPVRVAALEEQTGNHSRFLAIPYVLSGLVIFLCSYLTFAVAQGYTPVLDTMMNRVNIGGSVAISMILAAILTKLASTKSGWVSNWKVAAAALPLLTLFTLANIGLSAFWICSWEVQKNTRFLIQKQAQKINPGDCIILAHIHRYLMWAPVFDGTWDFQSMIRMTLNRNDIEGGVVSDRLSIQGNNIVDNSVGYVCASYPANKVTVLFPSEELWLPVRSAQGFVEAIEEHKSNLIIEQRTLDKWRDSLATSSQNKAP